MFKRFANMRIRTKLLIGLGIMFGLSLILFVFSLSTIMRLENNYNNSSVQTADGYRLTNELGRKINQIRQSVLQATILYNNEEVYEMLLGQYEDYMAEFTALADELANMARELDINQFPHKEDVVGQIEAFKDYAYDDCLFVSSSMQEAVGRKDEEEIYNIFLGGVSSAESVDQLLEELMVVVEDIRTTNLGILKKNNYIAISAMTGLEIVSLICMVFTGLAMAGAIQRPISRLQKAADKISKGDLNTSLRNNSVNEIGHLANMFGDVVDVFSMLVHEINIASQQQQEGNMNVQIDENAFFGDYRMAAKAVNQLIKNYEDVIHELAACAKAYAVGDFSVSLPVFPGERHMVNGVFDTLKGNLSAINSGIYRVVESASEGDLDSRINVSMYEGDWKTMAEGINRFVQAVQVPVDEVRNVLLEIAEGNLDVEITGDYGGDFDEMKQTVNTMIKVFKSYIGNIQDVLYKLSEKELDIEVEMEYVGDFAVIKESLTMMINTLNALMREFHTSANQVSTGANQISDSSIYLTEGVNQQSQALELITEQINTIAVQSFENAGNSEKANELSMNAKEMGLNNKKEMEYLLRSMAEIEEASKSIYTIIKVIDDIAFQTNLLALNAAVEAARAGAQGRGFSVVAEEVRNLAGKSQTAASETEELIKRTVDIVSKGSRNANDTAVNLNAMVEKIEEISAIIDEVFVASTEQNMAVNKINDSIHQIAMITQSNSASFEQTAASAEELSGQAELLKEALSDFNYKNDNKV